MPIEAVPGMTTQQRQQTRDWAPWFTFVQRDKVKCVWCNETYAYKRVRALAHYGYGATSLRSVCVKAPSTVKRRFANCGGVIPPKMTDAEINGAAPLLSRATSTPGSSQSARANDATESTENDCTPEGVPSVSADPRSQAGSSTPRSLRQQDMSEAYQIAKRKELDGKWASFFYEANVAFNIVRHPAFIAAVNATAQAGFDYKPPSYNAMRTTLIEPKKKQVAATIEERTSQCIDAYGATICCDGWDNVAHRPLLNVMLVCPLGDIFLGSIDTTGEKKTSAYVAEKLCHYIAKVGPEKVVQICTDNASAMTHAMTIVEGVYPKIYKQGCCAHIIDLLLEDLGKEEMINELVSLAKRVCKYIRNHHVTMALFRRFSPNLSLLFPGDTRFACNYLMIHRLLKVKEALERVVIDPRWNEYTATLFNRQNGHHAHALAGTVRNTILDANFWHRCENFEYMVEPILRALRVFDNGTPAMGRAWLTMNNLKNHIFSLRSPPFSLPPLVATRLEERFVARWDKLKTDLHYAGALLNPFLATNNEIQGDGDAKRALNRVVRRMCGPLGVTFEDAMLELTQYEERRGPYSPEETVDIRASGLLPHQWWNRIGGQALPIIAKRILALTCSASACERNWSMYSFVHSKSRNRLGVEKAESLVYIYANSKLLRERARPNPARWYDDNMQSEDSDPDGEEGYETDDDAADLHGAWAWDDFGPADVNRDEGDMANDAGQNVEHGHDGVQHVEADDMHEDEAHDHDHNIHGDPINPVDEFEYPREDNEPHNAGGAVAARMPHMWEDGDVNEEEDEENDDYERADDEPDDIDSIDNRSSSDSSDNDDAGNGIAGGVRTHLNNVGGNRTKGDTNEGERHLRGEDDVDNNRNPGNANKDRVSRSMGTDLHAGGRLASASVDVDVEENIPISQMFRVGATPAPRSLGSVLLGLRRHPNPIPSRPPVHYKSTAASSTLASRLSMPTIVGRASDERGPAVNRVVLGAAAPIPRGLGYTMAGQGGGSTRALAPGGSTTSPEIRPFYTGPMNTPSPSTNIGLRKVSIDGITDPSRRRRMKRLVLTNTEDSPALEVRNVNSELDEYITPALGDPKEMADGDDEQDDEDSDCDEAPCDDTVVVRGLGRLAGADRRRSKRRKAHISGE